MKDYVEADIEDWAKHIGHRNETLFLVNSLCMGGSEKKVIAISNALVRDGYRVHIAYLNKPDTLRSTIDPEISVVALGRTSKFSFAAVRRLRVHLQRNNIDRVVAVNLHPMLYAYLACRALRPPLGYVALVNTSSLRTRREALFMQIYAPLLRRAEQVVFGSESQGKEWAATYRLNRQRCRTIYNGVDTEYFGKALEQQMQPGSERISSLHAEGRFVIGSVGTLRSEKAHGDILRAAGILQRQGVPVSVLLVGSGPCEQYLRDVAARECLPDSVIFYGQAREVRPLLAAMDVFITSSVAVETFSNAALEAMASSRCVVLSDIGGAREMVEHEESGFIYPPGDVTKLAELLKMLHRNPVLRLRVAAAARARVTEQFSFDTMLKNYREHVISGEDCADQNISASLKKL